MTKLPDCDRCRYCARDYHIVCAIHPNGIEGDSCPDFSLAPERVSKRYESFSGLLAKAEASEEPNEHLYQKEGARFFNGELIIDRSGSFYNGEEIVQQGQRWSREEMLELLTSNQFSRANALNAEQQYKQITA